MFSQLITPRNALTSFTVLLALLAFLLPLTGRLGPIPPSPDIVLFVNDQELHPISQPVIVNVPQGQLAQVKVQAYYRGQPINPGEFSYQWCFTPTINDNRLCQVDNYRAETNSDYKPKNQDTQGLEITVKHDFLKTETVTVLFKPE